MATHYIFNDLFGAGTLISLADGNDLSVEAGARIASTSDYAISATHSGHAIQVLGTISGEQAAIHIGNQATDTDNRVQVAQGATVKSINGYAITMTGKDGVVSNAGTILSGFSGVNLIPNRQTQIVNTGTIDAKWAVVVTSYANDNSHDVTKFTNFGTVNGTGAAFNGGWDSEHVINRGTINGDIYLNDGNDFYDGRRGVVEGKIHGSDGDDRFVPGESEEWIDGGWAGVDALDFRSGSGLRVSLIDDSGTGRALGDSYSGFERVLGSATGSDELIGDAAANELTGLGGTDALEGGAGADSLWGGYGWDVLTGGTEADVLDGGAGRDTAAYTTAVTVTLDGAWAATGEAAGDIFLSIENLSGSDYADTMRGNAGANTLVGGDGKDGIYGVAGDDRLEGGDGNDFIAGGVGADRLLGGEGNDVFAFYNLGESAPGLADRILDFEEGEDDIWLPSIDAHEGLAGNQAFALDLDGSFSAGEIRQRVTNGHLRLEFNVDADADAEMAVMLRGQTGLLSAGDFVL